MIIRRRKRRPTILSIVREIAAILAEDPGTICEEMFSTMFLAAVDMAADSPIAK